MKVERIARALGSKLISIHFKNGGTLMVGDETTYPAESLLHAKGLMELEVVIWSKAGRWLSRSPRLELWEHLSLSRSCSWTRISLT